MVGDDGVVLVGPERLWSRRYRVTVVADEQVAHARLRHVLARGAKEGLVGSSGAWPSPNCVEALTTGALLRGTWLDPSAEFKARQGGESVLPSQLASSFDVRLTPLPCLQHVTRDAPFVHASDDPTEVEFRNAYRAQPRQLPRRLMGRCN